MLDEAARWDDVVIGLRLMSYRAKGVLARCLVSVGPTTTAKASSEGWRLRLRPNIPITMRLAGNAIPLISTHTFKQMLSARILPPAESILMGVDMVVIGRLCASTHDAVMKECVAPVSNNTSAVGDLRLTKVLKNRI